MDRVRMQIELTDINKTGKSIGIAVLDTGMAMHPDIKNRVRYFKDFVNGLDRIYDDNSHGTHISGILCGDGSMSDGKYQGIAKESELIICKVLDHRGQGRALTMLQALEFIKRFRKQLDVRIINISVGIGELTDFKTMEKLQMIIEELWEEGVVVVCAAGNKGPNDESISAVSSSAKVITVGCHDGEYFKDNKDRCEYHSGRGKRRDLIRKPDVVAPGTQIVSCNSEWNKSQGNSRKYYVEKSGTSMATAIVSGCIALLLESEPWLSPYQIKSKIQYTATDLGELWNKQGWGMINGKRLLEIY